MFVLIHHIRFLLLLISCKISQVSDTFFLMYANTGIHIVGFLLRTALTYCCVLFSPQLLERTNSGFEEPDSGATKSPLHLAVSEMLWATLLVIERASVFLTLGCSENESIGMQK